MTEVNASAGTFFFLASHFARETFSSTGLADVTSLSLDLGLASNNLRNGASVDFDLLLNGIDVGDISFDENDALGLFNFGFAFAPANGTVPEPASLALVGLALGVAGWVRRHGGPATSAPFGRV